MLNKGISHRAWDTCVDNISHRAWDACVDKRELCKLYVYFTKIDYPISHLEINPILLRPLAYF